MVHSFTFATHFRSRAMQMGVDKTSYWKRLSQPVPVQLFFFAFLPLCPTLSRAILLHIPSIPLHQSLLISLHRSSHSAAVFAEEPVKMAPAAV